MEGDEVRLSWMFQIQTNIKFYGIVWTIRDPVLKNYTKLVWMDRNERLYRHLHTKGRPEYDVRFISETINQTNIQLSIVIPKVQHIHENKYSCYLIKSKIGPSQIELKVRDKGELIFLE